MAARFSTLMFMSVNIPSLPLPQVSLKNPTLLRASTAVRFAKCCAEACGEEAPLTGV